MNGTWLTVLMAVPLVGAAVLAALPRSIDETLVKRVALGVSLVPLAIGAALAVAYDPGAGYQFGVEVEWIPAFGAHFALGLDGIGLALVLMTVILTPVVILASWHDADNGRWSVASFFAWMLALEGLAIGVFAATDVFLFYVLFEATLIPIYFLIGGFGGPQRAAAAMKFLIYSLVGGLLMLAAVIGLYVVSADSEFGPTYLLSELQQVEMATDVGRWLFLGFFVAFAIKAPMFPVHTWLPDAAAQGTPGTSVLLVSILDKIGTFGMIRFCLTLFPEASQWATPVVLVLALLSIVYGALMAIGQDNIPRLIAYTSVSHFGFIVLGIFVMNSYGGSGATLYMFNHGLSTAALFLVTGYLIRRRGSALISDYGGVEKVAPVLAGILLFAGLSSLSLPGLSPFVSEFLVLVGSWQYAPWVAIVGVSGIVLAALYILLMYQRTMTGPTRPEVAEMGDLKVREVVALAPVLVLILGLGLFPKPLLSVINPAVEDTLVFVDGNSSPVSPAGELAAESSEEGGN